MAVIKLDFLPADRTESYSNLDLERKGKVLEILKHFAQGKTIGFKKDFDAEVVSVAMAIIRGIQNSF